ncbi:MAG: DUF445 domain-containing protein [Bacillota bacterium]
MIKILIMAFVGGVIGWITNVLAIKMLFRPIKPITVPILRITIQGLIPRRRNEISRSIGEAVENELVNMKEILDKLLTEESKSEVITGIKSKVALALEQKLPSLIPGSIKVKISEYIGEQIEKEGIAILNSTIDDFADKAIDSIKIGKMVEDKIDEFELEKIEEMIIKLSSRELKHIEILGGVLGVIIGLAQGLVMQLF